MLQKLTKKKLTKKTVSKIPENPGVYVFWGDKRPLYIGKAINLKSRISSYLTENLASKTSKMIREAQHVSWIEVTSELESLLLEARLVRKIKPHFNVQLKDDKHPLYIKITNEKYPRVMTARKKDKKEKNIAFYGPFPSSRNVRSVLKNLRKIFPWSMHKPEKKRCIYSQIGLCNPCPSIIEKQKNQDKKSELIKEYKANISQLKGVLSGKIVFVRNDLEKKMKKASKLKDFEKAAVLRDKIDKLDYITQPAIPIDRFFENPNLAADIRNEEMKKLRDLLKNYIKVGKKLKRIECFDVSHISGVYSTASMVTFVEGEPDKAYYRHFKINQKKSADDISSMKEVAKRRAKHFSGWGVPDLIIVDGGKAQVNAFLGVFKDKDIPVVGLAKKEEKLVIPKEKNFVQFAVPKGPARNLVQRLRDEAHRFAQRYHHKLLKKSLIPS